MNDRPVTKGRRLFRLASMTARVAGGYAKSRIKSVFQNDEDAERDRSATHTRSGEIIAKTLGELKGAVMKVGQMASIARDILPKEMAEALGSLQREAPPMPYEVIAEQVERELGSPPEALFARFDRVPFAAASIGQVHRARTDDGREVVVKVQYPGVDDAVDSDLSSLRLALRASGLIKLKRQALDALFAELRTRLHEELDYCNEADNVRFFADYYRDNPEVVVPDVVGERSSQRVLTLTYEPGDHIDETDSYPQQLRDRLGANVFRTMCDQIFELQVIHADPNPANFAFREDGTLVFYDFGCVKRLRPEVIAAYRKTIASGLDEDYDGVERGLVELGARNLEGPVVPPEYYKMWRDILTEPFVAVGDYDYGRADIHHRALEHIPGFLMKYIGSFQPPAELVFLDRVVVGHYGTMRRLRARGHFGDVLRSHLVSA
ncbi:MAG: AarF/ABC1/UbiB kinase family protein [Deltaproteobacteria bacterium]|nr:AarF/ABC1/UbiB kinase family protein [Nannocystaceae bacterium]